MIHGIHPFGGSAPGRRERPDGRSDGSREDWLTESDWVDFRRQRIAGNLALGLSPEAAQAAAARAEAQMRARLDWLRERLARTAELWDRLGRFWNDYFDAHPELDGEDPDPADLPPDPPEQSELEAIEAEIRAARERDVWPRHLYFGEV